MFEVCFESKSPMGKWRTLPYIIDMIRFNMFNSYLFLKYCEDKIPFLDYSVKVFYCDVFSSIFSNCLWCWNLHSLGSGTGRVPDQLVNLDMKHGVEAKNYEEVSVCGSFLLSNAVKIFIGVTSLFPFGRLCLCSLLSRHSTHLVAVNQRPDSSWLLRRCPDVIPFIEDLSPFHTPGSALPTLCKIFS